MSLPNKAKIFSFPIIIYIIGVLIFSIFNYQNEKKKMIEEIDQQLLQTARTLKFILPRNFHDRAISQSSISIAEDYKNRELLSRLATEFHVHHIYSLVQRGSSVHYSSSSKSDSNSQREKMDYWMIYKNPTERVRSTFKEKNPSFKTSSENQRTFRTVLMPETSVSGQIYIVGVHQDIGFLNEGLFYRMLEVFVKLAFLLLLLIPFCYAYLKHSKNFSQLLVDQVKVRTIELEMETQNRIKSEEKRKKLEDRLLLSQKLESLGTLAAGIAHEINTPIQFIRDNLTFLTEECKNLIFVLKNNIQWIQKEDDLEKVRLKISQDEIVQDLAYLETEIPKALEEAGEGAQRVSKIVQSIRIFSHLNENKGSKVSVDLNKSLEPALFLSKSEWKQIAKVELIPQESLPLVKCYITEINQVVMNLIINAIHSIEEKQSKTQKNNFIGQVKIFTYKEEDSIVIRIEDNGKGIPKAIQEKVYDPFFTTKEVGKGTGQGLSLCYKTIVEGHNGELYFETKENQGTTFFIKLPT